MFEEQFWFTIDFHCMDKNTAEILLNVFMVYAMQDE